MGSLRLGGASSEHAGDAKRHDALHQAESADLDESEYSLPEIDDRLHALIRPDTDAMRAKGLVNIRELLRFEIEGLSATLPSDMKQKLAQAFAQGRGWASPRPRWPG